MVMDKAKKESTVEEILEAERKRFFGAKCFKFGQICFFRLSNCACDVRNCFTSDVFPAMKLLDAKEVRNVLGSDKVENTKTSPFLKMCSEKDQELDFTCGGVHEKFRVVVATHFKEEDYVEFLEAMFPLELCQPIKVTIAS